MPIPSQDQHWQLPKGFALASGSLRLRGSDRDDCLLITSKSPLTVSGAFTQNLFCGAPVMLNKQRLKKSGNKAHAVLINTVFANAGTGTEGVDRALKISEILAKLLEIPTDEVLLASTGKIGPQLPVEKFVKYLPELANNPDNNIERAAKAILTTDLVLKAECVTLEGGVTILGIAKGSGMIAPNMATMLAFIMTDAEIEKTVLDREWKRICRDTFNQVSVDGCQSTSDMALVLSSNQIKADQVELISALRSIARELAKKIAADGEGANHLIEVIASNCSTKADARTLAKAVVSSDLFKAAVAGHDPNWGRIASALGAAGVPFDPQKIDIFLDDQPVFLEGAPVEIPDPSQLFQQKTVQVLIDFHNGSSTGRAWGCDLTKKYVEINAEYST